MFYWIFFCCFSLSLCWRTSFFPTSWRNLIESACQWSCNNKSYEPPVLDLQWTDFMLTTNRQFGTIVLESKRPVDTTKMLEVFQRHGTNVVKLHLRNCHIDSFIEFAEVLMCMPNLKHVIVELTTTRCKASDVPAVSDLPEVKKLKILDMDDSECSIIKCFQRSKLTTLKIRGLSTESTLDCEVYKDFLISQEMLKLLAIESMSMTSTQFLSASVPFHLTQLSLSWEFDLSSIDACTNVMHFLGGQATTLKILELARTIPSYIFKFVFANMTKLNTLSVMMVHMPRDKEFYERLKENHSITNLILWDSTFYYKNTQKLFERLPNIRSVTVPEYCNSITLRHLTQCFSKLESLVMICPRDNNFNSLYFPNLKSIQFESLYGTVDWSKFVEAHPRLTDLTITNIRNESLFNMDDFEMITSNCNLQRIRFGRFFTADKRFFEIIQKNCPDLKVLDLHKFSVSDELNNNIYCNVLRLRDRISIEYGEFFTSLENWSWHW